MFLKHFSFGHLQLICTLPAAGDNDDDDDHKDGGDDAYDDISFQHK